MIHQTQRDYIETLQELIHNENRVGGTIEEVAAQLHFISSCDLSAISPKHYNEAVWEAIETAGRGLAISASLHSNLNFYCKKFNVWMTPSECIRYGQAAFAQLPRVTAELSANRETRRAVMTFDVSGCEQSVQWLARTIERECLFVVANFRSLDALHLPTDFFVLQKLTALLTPTLGVFDKVCYTFNAGSFHIYDRDVPRITPPVII